MENVKIPLPLKPIRFLDQFRAFIRKDGKSYATENTYVHWVHQYILFNNKEHPEKLGAKHIEAYLSHLALVSEAAPNTQKTALNAIMFLYNRFLNKPIEKLDFQYAKKPQKIPTVFTHEEALAVIDCMVMPYKLMAQIMYGAGCILWTNKMTCHIRNYFYRSFQKWTDKLLSCPLMLSILIIYNAE